MSGSPRTIYVSPAQVLAAKLQIELHEEAGEQVDEALKAIAQAQAQVLAAKLQIELHEEAGEQVDEALKAIAQAQPDERRRRRQRKAGHRPMNTYEIFWTHEVVTRFEATRMASEGDAVVFYDQDEAILIVPSHSYTHIHKAVDDGS